MKLTILTRSAHLLLALLTLAAFLGCETSLDIESRLYHCESDEDCLEGYECRQVSTAQSACIPEEADAGLDAGADSGVDAADAADGSDVDSPDADASDVSDDGGQDVDARDATEDVLEDAVDTDEGDADAEDTTDDADTCGSGLQLCGTECVDISSDPSHCGGCNSPCDASLPNTLPVCQTSMCGLACDTGWYDANGDLDESGSDGCESECPTVSTEICDGVDNDCDGDIDEDFQSGTCTVGVGACEETGSWTCTASGGQTCSASPGSPSTEVCDGVDNNCDGDVDEGLSCSGTDSDGDGHTVQDGDCDDSDGSVYPGATEICDGVDNDCDGDIDEGYNAGDICSAGVGECENLGVWECSSTTSTSCSATAGTGSTETCDGRDNDCNGFADDGISCPSDYDQDGVTKNQGDCDDGDASVYPGATEVCNGIDDDCDGQYDEDDPQLGASCQTGNQGVCAEGEMQCVSGQLSCEPLQTATNEICNGKDDDCNGTVDDTGSTCTDADLDGWSPGAGDCDDSDPTIHPDAKDHCNGVDDDCDGTTDEAFYATDVTAGVLHSCAIGIDGETHCWGENTEGQIGDGSTVTRYYPTKVNTTVQMEHIDAGVRYTCGVTSAGAAYCWGGPNGYGELGNGSQGSGSTTPVRVSGQYMFETPTIYTSVLTDSSGHVCAHTKSGEALCWGHNSDGQLGNGSMSAANTPQLVSGSRTYIDMGAGNRTTCAIGSDELVYCWGNDGWGQVGDGPTTNTTTTPVQVDSNVLFQSVTGGRFFQCGLAKNGDAYCWGDNAGGELGDGTTDSSDSPVKVVGGHTFVQLDAASGHVCAVSQTGRGYCWGTSYRALGSSATSSPSPLLVEGDHTWQKIVPGQYHTCGIAEDGRVFCWGANAYGQDTTGQLGIGNTSQDETLPVPVVCP